VSVQGEACKVEIG